MTRPVYIYALCERGKDEVRYVGQTVNPEQRLKAHVGESRLESSHPKERWIAEVMLMGSDIEMRIIEECTVESAGDREKHWIAYHLERSPNLTNLSHGAACRFADGVNGSDTKVTGYRLTVEDLARIDFIAKRCTDGNKTDAVKLAVREKYERLIELDLIALMEEQERRIRLLEERLTQLENKKP